MAKLKLVPNVNQNDILADARAAAQIWAGQVGRTHSALYRALAGSLIVYRSAQRDRPGFDLLCSRAGVSVTGRANSELALSVVKLVFSVTPDEVDARSRFGSWGTVLLALDQARPRLTSVEAATAWLERVSITKAVADYRARNRGLIDKQALLAAEIDRDDRIADFLSRSVPLEKLKLPERRALIVVDSGRARVLDLDPTQVRSLLLKVLA